MIVDASLQVCSNQITSMQLHYNERVNRKIREVLGTIFRNLSV